MRDGGGLRNIGSILLYLLSPISLFFPVFLSLFFSLSLPRSPFLHIASLNSPANIAGAKTFIYGNLTRNSIRGEHTLRLASGI